MTVIRRLNVKCPICVAPFPSDVMLSTDLFRNLHSDLLEEAGGPETLAALVHVCPRCGYARRTTTSSCARVFRRMAAAG